MTDTASHDVEAFVHRFLEGYSAKDADALQALLVGEEIVLVGTGTDEVRFGLAAFREQAERDFSQSEDLAMSVDNLRVTTFGDAAFAYCDITVSGAAGGQAFEMSGLRCTFGMVRTADGWRIAQSHLSAPAGGQEEGSSF